MKYPKGYDEGFDAYMKYEGIRSNPFNVGSNEYNNFKIGYSDAAYQRDYDPKRTLKEALA